MGNIVEKEFTEKVKEIARMEGTLQERWDALWDYAAIAQARWELEEALRLPWRRPSRFQTVEEYRNQ